MKPGAWINFDEFEHIEFNSKGARKFAASVSWQVRRQVKLNLHHIVERQINEITDNLDRVTMPVNLRRIPL